MCVPSGRDAIDELRGRPVEEVANLAADTIATQLNNPDLSMPDAADAFFASRGYPQSPVGHVGRIADIRGDVATQLPGMQVLGAGYDGPDVSYCVATAFNMAKEMGRVLKLESRRTEARSAAQGGGGEGAGGVDGVDGVDESVDQQVETSSSESTTTGNVGNEDGGRGPTKE